MNQNNNIKLYNRRICLKVNSGSNNTRICIFSIGFNVKVNWDYLPLNLNIPTKTIVYTRCLTDNNVVSSLSMYRMYQDRTFAKYLSFAYCVRPRTYATEYCVPIEKR